MLLLSQVNQIWSQLIHISLEIILCGQITTENLDFNRDSGEKLLAGTEFPTFNLPTQIFFDLQPCLSSGFGHFHGSAWPGPSKCLLVFRGITLQRSPARFFFFIPKIRPDHVKGFLDFRYEFFVVPFRCNKGWWRTVLDSTPLFPE